MTARACMPQVRYEVVPEEELERQRTQFRNGQLAIKIEESTFSMKCAPFLPGQQYLFASLFTEAARARALFFLLEP